AVLAAGTAGGREIRAALPLRDTGNLPAVDDSGCELIAMYRITLFNGIRSVEDVPPVAGLHTVVVPEIEWIENCSAAAQFVITGIHDAQRLAVGVVRADGVA